MHTYSAYPSRISMCQSVSANLAHNLVPIPTKHPLLLEDPTGLHLSFSELCNDSLLALSIQHSYKHRGAIFLPALGE